MTDAERAPEPTALIVVRVGAIDRFGALRAAFVPDGVEVIWDRRFGERRQPPANPMSVERRRRDRRGTVSASWTLLDFIVVPPRPLAS